MHLYLKSSGLSIRNLEDESCLLISSACPLTYLYHLAPDEGRICAPESVNVRRDDRQYIHELRQASGISSLNRVRCLINGNPKCMAWYAYACFIPSSVVPQTKPTPGPDFLCRCSSAERPLIDAHTGLARRVATRELLANTRRLLSPRVLLS